MFVYVGSILNSVVIVLFLSGMVAMIMLRTLHKDIARYNQMDDSVSWRSCIRAVVDLIFAMMAFIGHDLVIRLHCMCGVQLHINISLSLNRPPGHTWRCPPGCPRNKLLDQLRNESTRPTGELWCRAVDRGHGGATTRQPSPAMRP